MRIGERLTWGVWIVLLVVLPARPLFSGRVHTVYPIYAQAAHDWLAGAKLYGLENRTPGLDQFRYAPAFAVVLVPLAAIPEPCGELLWRLFGDALFLTGFVSFARTFLADAWLAPGRRALLLLVLVPLSIGSLNNAQVNVHMTGALLLAMSAVAHERWNIAALCLAASILCKVYPIALALLLVLRSPKQFGGRLLLCLSIGLLLPFAAQSPSYALEQYWHWSNMLSFDDRRELPLGLGYRDFDQLLRACGVVLSRHAYLAVQMGTALVLAIHCWMERHTRHALPTLFDLACCWMILFGPATESCTYILLAPTLACAVLDAWQSDRRNLVLLGPALGLLLVAVIGTGFGMAKSQMALAQVSGAALLCLARIVRIPSLRFALAGARERLVVN